LHEDNAKWLAAFGRKVSRKFGGVKVNKNWRKRYNKESIPIVESQIYFHLSE
jgi:hypothetical protein